jgi:O-antigen ligase
VLATQLVPGQSIQRSLSFLAGSGSGLNSNGRSQLWSEAWSHFLAHPVFGLGTGSFQHIAPTDFYPHNLLLEIGVELGLVGLIIVAGFLVTAWLATARARILPGPARLQAAVVTALFSSAVVNAMFSGDIQTNANLWLVAGLALGLAMRGGAAADAAVPAGSAAASAHR